MTADSDHKNPSDNPGKSRQSDLPSTKEQYADKKKMRDRMPVWMRDLPKPGFPRKPDPNYHLISEKDLAQLRAQGLDEAAVKRIEADREFLDYELLRLFRERDHEAGREQNRYRLYQITFIVLATFATIFGSVQALMLANRPEWVPFFALLETIVALLTTFIATLRGNKPPLMSWLDNRRRAEQMRREYFRFIMRLPPYHNADPDKPYELKVKLSKRAADINKGLFPEEPTVLQPQGDNKR